MEVNKIQFESLFSVKVSQSFEDLDVNTDGVISHKDISATDNVVLKSAISEVLNSIDAEDSIEIVEEVPLAKAGASSSGTSNQGTSVRQTSQNGLPVTDSNTFENDVLNSSGTVYLYVGPPNNSSSTFGSCEKRAVESMERLKNYANFYHLDNEVNEDLAEKLRKQAGMDNAYSSFILKFVDGKLVEEISLSTAYNVQNLIDKAVGEPSPVPDIPAPEDQNPNAPTNRYGVKTTNTANFENDVLNSKGTVYVTIGNINSCTYCTQLQEAIKANAQTINAVATVYDLSTDTDTDLCWKIYKEMAGNTDATQMSLPQIAKFVDGKFVQLVPKSIATGTLANMIKLAEGSCKKDKDGIAQTSAASFEEDITNSKGTTYVMITSADGCSYCNYLHYQMKDLMSDFKDKFGFYELTANQGADSDLCWQIYRDMGGGDGTKAMNLPQIAKFVDGKFVELLTNTRDYGTPGLDNATIKEMIAKAEGTPVNNATSNSTQTQVDATKTDENSDLKSASVNTFDWEEEKNLFEQNIMKIRKEDAKLENEIISKELQKNLQEEKIAQLQEKYNKLEKKLKNADENEDTSSIKSEMSSLKSKIETASFTLKILQQDISNLELKRVNKAKELRLQNESFEKLIKKQLES